MTTKELPVAQQIEKRIVHLSDPNVRWVNRSPSAPGESCLAFDGRAQGLVEAIYIGSGFSYYAGDWLDDWFLWATSADFADSLWDDIGYDSVEWNDNVARNLDQVIDMLAWAWMDAIEEGV